MLNFEFFHFQSVPIWYKNAFICGLMSSLNLASKQMTVERNLSTIAGSGKLKRYLTVV